MAVGASSLARQFGVPDDDVLGEARPLFAQSIPSAPLLVLAPLRAAAAAAEASLVQVRNFTPARRKLRALAAAAPAVTVDERGSQMEEPPLAHEGFRAPRPKMLLLLPLLLSKLDVGLPNMRID